MLVLNIVFHKSSGILAFPQYEGGLLLYPYHLIYEAYKLTPVTNSIKKIIKN